jgi:lysophospholipase L1-like esterase
MNRSIKYNLTLLSIVSNILLIVLIFFILKLDTVRVELYQQLVRHYGKVEIIFIGDSLTRRNSDIAMFTGGFRFNVINKAIDGYTIPQISKQLIDSLIPLSPCLVIVMAGTNRQEGDSLKSNLNQYQNILDNLISNNINVILLETLSTQRATLNTYINQLNENLRNIAKEKNIRFFPSNEYLTKNGKLLSEYTKDGVHLNERGYKALNNQLIPYIKHSYSSKREECNNII